MSGFKTWHDETGLEAMKTRLAEPEARQAFAALAEALRENLHAERTRGASPDLSRERTRLVMELNKLALQHTKESFNKMCGM